MKRKKSRLMKIYKKYGVKEILPYISLDAKKGDTINLEGFDVNCFSTRLKCFKINLKCSKCNRVGTYFNLERPLYQENEKPHLNLYSEDNVLMTQDHIIPKSKGGSDSLTNLETMCIECNNLKGNTLINNN